MPGPDDLKPRRLSIDDEGQRYPLEKMTGGSRSRRAAIHSIHQQAGRVPPQALDVEQSVLGAMLIEPEAIPRAIEILSADAFYSTKHQQIYRAVLRLFERANPVDLITLSEELKRNGDLETVGGTFYLSELTTQVASAANVEYHARIVAEKSLLRKMIETMTTLVGQAYDASADAFELLDRAETEVFRISDTQVRKAASLMKDVVKETFEQLQAIHGRPGGITGVPSGFARLDELTSGWQRSDLIIIAARPSMGKCLGQGTPVMLYDGTIKPVEAVRIGDRLMGDDSTPRTVRSLARGFEMMYWVRQQHGMDYRVNESHMLSLKPRCPADAESPEAVVDLSTREYLEKPARWREARGGYKVAVAFPERPLPLDPYRLGRWLGQRDGDPVHDDPPGVSAANVGSDLPPAGQGIRDSPGDFAPAILHELGVLNSPHIPHEYLANSAASRLRLLAGLLDGTGSVHAGTCEIALSDKRLAIQTKYLADTLGFRTSLEAERSASPNDEATLYRVRLEGDVDRIPTRIANTQIRAGTSTGNWRVTGITVEPDGFDRYYGFVLDGNRRFLLADATVTHNTAFALACARNAAMHPHHAAGVAVFSLEMGAQQLAQRLLTSEARVDAQAARTGRMSDDDWQRLARAAGRLSEAPVFIDDTPGLSILELRAKCRRLKAEHDVGLIVVDYLQLMQAPTTSRGSNREQEIAEISRSLKSLAKELDVPVLALSQLSRAVETRGGDKRPQLSDLRESGCLTGDTRVLLADTGERVPICDLVGRSNFRVWALNPLSYKLERARVSRAFSTGVKPVLRVSTQLGRQIRATGNHKFLTVEGWRPLDRLDPGDRIALSRSLSSSRMMLSVGPGLPEHLAGSGWVPFHRALECTTLSHGRARHAAATDLPDEWLHRSQSDVYWDRIASIEPDGVEEVFDLTVPGPHNFVANDLIVHNSIEQDADVVLFIYRPERYGITVDENGNSTEGLSEIIIGKQRNGPVGNVQLAFVQQFARFESLTTYYREPGAADDYSAAPLPPTDDAPF